MSRFTFISNFTAGLTGFMLVALGASLFAFWHGIPDWMLATAIGSGCTVYLAMRLFHSLPILPMYFMFPP